MPKLESEVVRSIRALCEHGDTLVKMKEYSFAISKYYEALSLIPDPKEEYKPAAWIYTSMGETYWKLKDYNNAGMAYTKARRCEGASQNAIVNLRMGECLYECGYKNHAAEFLCQAYMIDGTSVFEGEDPKYFELIRCEVEGAPDDMEDEEIEDGIGNDDYYLVDNMLGCAPRPAEYDEPDDGYIDDENVEMSYDDEDPYEEYDRRTYGDDDGDDGYSGRPKNPAYDMDDSYDDDTDGYFDGGDYDYDDDDDEDQESPVKRFTSWFLDLFR